MAKRFVLPTWQEFDSNGDPLAGGKLNFYESGTTTRKNTYSDSSLETANANPVVADSAGRFGNIFLAAGDYRVVLTTSAGVTIWDRDPVEGGTGGSGSVDEKDSAYTITVDDATKIIAVDATDGTITITLPPAATAGDGFEVSVLKSDSSSNAVTIDGNGSETINGAATYVLPTRYASVTLRCDGENWQIVARYRKTEQWVKGDDVASAAALTLGDGNYFDITGTTAITSIGTKGVGTVVKLHFDGALTLTHHATDLILPGAASITTAAGDEAEFVEYASGDWRCTNYIRAASVPLAFASQTDMETGTSTTTAVSPGVVQNHKSAAKAHASYDAAGTIAGPSYNVSSVTDVGTGQLTPNWGTNFSSTAYTVIATAESSGSAIATVVDSKDAGGATISTWTVSDTPTRGDVTRTHVAAYGDHA